MMWLTWRRYRVRIILLALYVVALIVFMIITEHAYQSALTSCGFRATGTQLSAAVLSLGRRVTLPTLSMDCRFCHS